MITNHLYRIMLRCGVSTVLMTLLCLQGCSITPAGKASGAPALIKPAAKTATVKHPMPAVTPETKSEAEVADCVFRPSKGIAELLAVENGQWLMRFHPGDIPFVHASAAALSPDTAEDSNAPGQEFRALMYTRDSGPCDPHYFELLGALH